MLHRSRVHAVKDVADSEELARLLVVHTWTLCTGFRHGGLLWLNGATGPDGAQEYAVVRDGRQVESITFSWCDVPSAAAIVRALVAGAAGADYGPAGERVDVAPEHSCRHCA